MNDKQDFVTESNSPTTDTATRTILMIESGSIAAAVFFVAVELGIIEDESIFFAFLADIGITGKIQFAEHVVDSSMDCYAIAKEITTVK